jgi:peroxiredoxin
MIFVFKLSRKRFYNIFTIILVVSCGILFSCESKEAKTTYITGKIINPTARFVVLTDHHGQRDTVDLDENDKFSIGYDTFKTGLVRFSHPNEFQTLFVAEGDSICLRINTKAFDESLAFTGDRSEENNFLINRFIEIEKSNRSLIGSFKLDPDSFTKLIDSTEQDRIARLKDAAQKKDFHEDFVALMQRSFELSSASRKERYPFTHYGRNKLLEAKQLPETFFSHRDCINVNDPELLNDYTFRSYVNALVSNIALLNTAENYGTDFIENRNSLEYRTEKLRIIDSLFKAPKAKEQFAASETRNFIRTRKNAQEIEKLVSTFLRISTDDTLNNSIQELAGTYIIIEPGKKMDNLTLQDASNNSVLLADRIKQLSVIFFWSQDYPDYAVRIHKKVRELKIKYPNIEFIGINIDDSDADDWKKINAEYRFNLANEYQLKNLDNVIPDLEITNRNRTMVVDKDLTIIDPSINLFHFKVETVLLGYLNR